MNKWSEVIGGLVLVIIPVVLVLTTWGNGTWDFGLAAWIFLKGGLMWFIFLIGLLLIMLGIADLKDESSKTAPKPAPMPMPAPVSSMPAQISTSTTPAPKKRGRKPKRG